MLRQYQKAIEKNSLIFKTDGNGTIIFVSDLLCKILGFLKEDILGKEYSLIFSSFKSVLFYKRKKKRENYKSRVRARAKEGALFYFDIVVVPILDKDESVVEFFVLCCDVTQEVFYKELLKEKESLFEKRVEAKTKALKRLNETLELRVKEEIKKNEEKQRVMFWQSRFASLGEMIANVAHQWRQPLTELNLTLFSLKKAAFNQKSAEVDLLYKESRALIQNMSNTIEDFSNFFKPDKEKYSFMLHEAVEEGLHILKRMIKKDMIQIKSVYEDINVLGIPNEFTQVIVNLLKNSRDAFVANGILIREIKIKIFKKSGYAFVVVEDNAGGIKEKERYKIFEPYFTTKHTSQGTGLGLFISKMICEKGFCGSLDVSSKRGVTSFTIKIPIEESDEK